MLYEHPSSIFAKMYLSGIHVTSFQIRTVITCRQSISLNSNKWQLQTTSHLYLTNETTKVSLAIAIIHNTLLYIVRCIERSFCCRYDVTIDLTCELYLNFPEFRYGVNRLKLFLHFKLCCTWYHLREGLEIGLELFLELISKGLLVLFEKLLQ